MSIEEMAARFNAAKSEHVWMFPTILLNTLCRPDAALDLTIFQAGREHGLLDLNPPGRKKTKKFRPIVPITRTLGPGLTQPVTMHKGKKVKPTHLIHYHGGPTGSMKTAWRELREAAGYMVPNPTWTLAAPEIVPQMIPDLRVNPHSIRHTMGRELWKRRVPTVEISLMLGHLRREGASTSLTYAPYDPDYCRNAIKAIDDYRTKLKRLVKRPMKPPFDPALRARCELERPGKTTKLSAKRLIWMVGATGIEPVTLISPA